MSRRFFLALLTVMLLDQVSKFFWTFGHGREALINQGISFQLFHQVLPNWLLGAFLLILLAGGVWWLQKSCLLSRYSLEVGVFIGGALSNLVDRVLFGGVRDWLWVPGLSVYNNLADWAIFLAVTVVIWRELRSGKGIHEHE